MFVTPHNMLSNASAECLPSYLEYLIAESHNRFAKLLVRQCQYNELYEAINDGSQPMKIPSHCKTRWLSIQPAIENIIAQWLELKAYFNIARLSDKCYAVELLFEMYSDGKKLAFLLFCNQSWLMCRKLLSCLNKKNVDKVKLLDYLTLTFKSIFSKLILPSCKTDPLNCTIDDYLNPIPYLGYLFESNISELKSETS